MQYFAAWALFSLGFIHILFGFVKFRKPLASAISGGFVNQFKEINAYAAFWFLMTGPPLILSGHLSVRALAANDLNTVMVIGCYNFIFAVLGIIAFPKSPFWAPAFVSALLIATGTGML